MANVSIASVSADGFAAFGVELSSGEWNTIDISTFVGADGRAARPLGQASTFVTMKLQLTWSITDLMHAREGGICAKEALK